MRLTASATAPGMRQRIPLSPATTDCRVLGMTIPHWLSRLRASTRRRLQGDAQPSILEVIRAHLSEGRRLSADACVLPDDNCQSQNSALRWAAGALDGVSTHHMGPDQSADAARGIVDLVLRYSRQPSATNREAVYQQLVSAPVVSVVDSIIQMLVNMDGQDGLAHDRVYELARSFVTEATDREPVKLGIALLGLYRQPADTELFQILGRHDEFTLFCVVALANSPDNPEEALWTLARGVTGWGRIHVVERLAATNNPAIKRWLLREGYRNSVMYEYSAATCARAGELRSALGEGEVDRELLTSAGEIIQALLGNGPADGIDDYEDARPVLESYVSHMKASAETIQDFVHVDAVRGFLNEDDARWEGRYQAGWTAGGRHRLRLACDSILGRPEWVDRVRAQLSSNDEVEFHEAARAATALGLSAWADHWRRLIDKPTDFFRWVAVMTECDEGRIDAVTELALATLDVSRGQTDPTRLFGPHMCLNRVIKELERFPGRGTRLIEMGLASPDDSNRKAAEATLAAWSSLGLA
jgi:hypothetical protein